MREYVTIKREIIQNRGCEMLKKINAILALISVFLLLAHVVYEIWSYMSFYYNPGMTVLIAYGFVTCVMLHIVISVFIVAYKHDGDALGKYPKKNIRTIIQRASAAGILVLLPFHIKTGDWVTSHFGGTVFFIVLIVLGVLFWAFTFLHVGSSLTRALITLGIIKERKTQKIIDWTVWVISAALFVASVIIVIKTQVILFNMKQV